MNTEKVIILIKQWGREAGRAVVVGRGGGKDRELYLYSNNNKKYI